MFKIKMINTVGDTSEEIEIETDDMTLIREILASKQIIHVSSDRPNINIDRDWQEIIREMNKQHRPLTDPGYPPTVSPVYPGVMPYTITC